MKQIATLLHLFTDMCLSSSPWVVFSKNLEAQQMDWIVWDALATPGFKESVFSRTADQSCWPKFLQMYWWEHSSKSLLNKLLLWPKLPLSSFYPMCLGGLCYCLWEFSRKQTKQRQMDFQHRKSLTIALQLNISVSDADLWTGYCDVLGRQGRRGIMLRRIFMGNKKI